MSLRVKTQDVLDLAGKISAILGLMQELTPLVGLFQGWLDQVLDSGDVSEGERAELKAIRKQLEDRWKALEPRGGE